MNIIAYLVKKITFVCKNEECENQLDTEKKYYAILRKHFQNTNVTLKNLLTSQPCYKTVGVNLK